jgi:hypothetical protein
VVPDISCRGAIKQIGFRWPSGSLADLLNSKREAERRHAASELLSFAFRAHEAGELETRLAGLEKAADELTHRPGGRAAVLGRESPSGGSKRAERPCPQPQPFKTLEFLPLPA